MQALAQRNAGLAQNAGQIAERKNDARPGRYSRARKLAACAVQARRASELTSDSFHDIED